MMKYEHRMVYDLTLIAGGIVLIAARYWIRYRNRGWEKQSKGAAIAWVMSDVFLFFTLLACCSVIGFDVWILDKKIKYRDSTEPLVAEKLTLAVRLLQASMFNQFAYIAALWGVKASFLCSYYTMTGHLSSKYTRALMISAVFLAITFIGLVLAHVFWCQPLSTNWTIGPSFCSPQTYNEQAILVYAFHIGTDIPVMAIPFFIMRRLQLGRGERCAVGFLFSLGMMTAVSSTFSFALHLQFIRMQHSPSGSKSSNMEKTIEGIFLAAIAEVFGSVLVVCLPSLRVMIRSMNSHNSHGRDSQMLGRDGLIELIPEGEFQRARSTAKRAPVTQVSPQSTNSAEDVIPLSMHRVYNQPGYYWKRPEGLDT
ncbi:hypothetical protein EDC01DRAFT_462885 [Geopyxis carbonaria]|nr:hypothetical protein EDC01DRAFT_462885 [Geopyxis carbonaria]